MHIDSQPVYAGGKIIAAAAINIYCYIIRVGAETAANESLTDAIEADEMPPAPDIRVN